MRPDQVSIVIPALNEVGALGDVVAGLRGALPEVEVIVVDGGTGGRRHR